MNKSDIPYWKGKHFSCFTNKECEYYPCHKNETGKAFNCLFCYCPLYVLGSMCGGSFRILENGIKDCSECILPHDPENYGYITEKYSEICKVMKVMKPMLNDNKDITKQVEKTNKNK